VCEPHPCHAPNQNNTNNFLKGLTVQIQPHILEPDPVVLAEWNTAHMDFTKTQANARKYRTNTNSAREMLNT